MPSSARTALLKALGGANVFGVVRALAGAQVGQDLQIAVRMIIAS